MKNKIYTVLRITVSLIAIGGLLWWMRDELGDIFAALAQTKIWIFGLAFLTMVSTIFIISLRLKKIFQAQNIFLTLKDLIYLSFIGYFFNNFLPTALGGDVVKAYYAYKKTGKKLESFTAVLVDRTMGLFSLALIASIALIIAGRSIETTYIKAAILVILGGALLFGLILFNSAAASKFSLVLRIFRLVRIESKMKRIYDAVLSYRFHKRAIFQAFCISLVSQSVWISANYFLARSLSIDVHVKSFFLRLPIIMAAGMVPSIGGLGVSEGAYVYFFKDIIGANFAFATSLLVRASLLGIGLIGGVVYMLKGQFKTKGVKYD